MLATAAAKTMSSSWQTTLMESFIITLIWSEVCWHDTYMSQFALCICLHL